MAITLITGQPGHGKTLYALTLALKFKKEGRPVYVAGVKDLDYEKTGFLPLGDFTECDPADVDDQGRQMPKWQLLPHGSVIFVDECYDVLPQRPAGSKVPPHVDALARHRHHGYDIILVCQMHNQIDSFVKGLVDPHLHVRRKFGLKIAMIKQWDRFKSNTEMTDTLTTSTWRYPKSVYGIYTSATMHTVKRKLPWFVWALPVVLVFLGYNVWKSRAFIHGDQGTPASVSADGAAGGKTSKQSAKDDDDDLRRKDYVAWLKPRVPGQPWTAPAYDNLQPEGVPDLYCVASEDGRCSCITEQGTKYHMDLNVCRTIASEGQYNPFRRTPDIRQSKPSQVRPEGDQLAGDKVPVADASSLPVVPHVVAAAAPEVRHATSRFDR